MLLYLNAKRLSAVEDLCLFCKIKSFVAKLWKSSVATYIQLLFIVSLIQVQLSLVISILNSTVQLTG